MEEKFARYRNMLKAIEAERKNEEQYFKNLAAKRSVSQRLDSGLLWWGVKINSRRYGIGDVVEVQVERTRMTGEPHKLKVGAGVRLFKEGRDKDYQGVLSHIRKDRAVVSVLDERLMHDNDIQYGNVGLELVYDERPYKVMRNSIDSLLKSKEEHIMSIRDGLDKEDAFQEEWHHSVNLQALPFLPMDRLHESGNITPGSNIFNGYFVRDGAIGLFENYPYDFVAGTSFAGKEWSVSDVEIPFTRMRANIYTNVEAVEATALTSVGTDSNLKMTHFEEMAIWQRFM